MNGEIITLRTMKTFFLIWAGQLVSLLGSGLTSFAFSVWIFQTTGNATPLALTALFSILPRVLLFPAAGTLADRWNRRWVMVLSDTGSALSTLAILFLFSLGSLQVWHIYLAALISGLFGSFQEPAYISSISLLVPKKHLTRASGMIQMSQGIESLLTPLLAGLLYGTIGLQGIIWIDFATFIFAVSTLLFVQIPQPVVETEQGAGWKIILQDSVFGWKYLRMRPGLFGLLVYFALANFLLNISAILLSPLVLSFSTPEMLGVVQSALGLGMLAGSVIMSVWGGPQRRVLTVVLCLTMGGVGFAIAGLRPDPWLIGSGMFAALFFAPFGSGSAQAIFQIKVAPEVQGRVFAVRSLISRSMMPVAYLLSGPLADRVFEPLMQSGGPAEGTFLGALLQTGPGRGAGLMFVLSGVIMVIASAFAYSYSPIRNLEDELPDALPDVPEGVSEEPLPVPNA
jgi:MFS family permease